MTACKIETVKAIIKNINNDYFALLVDESRDVSRKEQMAICLIYVDKRGFVMEAFIGLVHSKDTSVLSPKEAIVDVLPHHSLTLSNVRGQCYDGESNMQGDLSGLKTLIRQESRPAHSVHCFAHQLQLTLDAVSKKYVQLQELNDHFNEVTSDFLNGVSCLNPIDSFSSFDIDKIMRMAELYPDDFDRSNMRALENQLVNYIIDVRDNDERFSNLGGLGELSRKLVETKKHLNYSLVFL
ncbi:uncharacterized protein LOC125858810 [Solanum stenotomum]|uniref:uncharacterized protein LOC125858810 n=1 Tax=Solanum stenotomum TaxID=172797 RepID=UPI0020D15D0B|nr:uncharacterized protein LOC125858810 [Solanum stenotomum]